MANNLLRFPTAKPPNLSFGTAIHSTLQHAHYLFSKYNEKQPVEDIVKFFENEIEKSIYWKRFKETQT